jgi:site-specific DNA recombinase
MTTIPKAPTSAFTNNQTGTPRVALYLRVSSNDQAQNGGSLSNQEQRLKEKADENGWLIYDYYRDAGKSGHIIKRPEFHRLMNDAREHKFNFIMFPLVNRFFREIRMGHNVMYEWKEQLGIDVLSLNGKFDTRHADWKHELNRQLDSAEEEWETISERTKTFRERQDEKHEWSAGRVKYGLTFDKEKGTNDSIHLKIDKPETIGVNEVFRIFTTGDRKDDKETAELMNRTTCILPKIKKEKQPDGKMKWKRATKWTPQLVNKILKDPAYLGGSPDHYPNGWTYNSPRIISEEVWNEAQRRRALNKHFPPEREANQKAEFEGGVCKCGLCGRTIALSYSGNKPDRYACRGRGVNGCTLPRFKRAPFEAAIHKKLDELGYSFDAFVAELRKNQARLKAEESVLKAEQKPIIDELNCIEEDMKGLDVMFWEYHRLNLPQYREKMDELKAKRDKLIADSGNDLERQKTLWREVEDIQMKAFEYDLGIQYLERYVKISDWESVRAALPSVKKDVPMFYRLAQDWKNYAKPESFRFTVKPNPDNPKDQEHPFIIEGEAILGMQQGSGSTCSR